MAGGYMGKVLNVDLSNRKLEEEALDEKLCRDFMGGYGLGAKVLFSRMRPKVDPLGPESILGVLTGPLTGTPALFGTRYCVVAKSPLTGTWGDANSGGDFGPYLKFSGYDGIFISGIADKPMYLFIDNGKAELRDASSLWGKETQDCEEILRAQLGRDVRSVWIGPAGEKKSLMALLINNKGRAAGRSGLGAVMGSKRLKAIVVKGNAEVPIADKVTATTLRQAHINLLKGHIDWFNGMRDLGTNSFYEPFLQIAEVMFKNWAGSPEDMDSTPIYGGRESVYKKAGYGCWRCPVACGALMKGGTGEYKYAEGVHRPEYETVAVFGPMCLNNNYESIIMANDICNRYGMDTISAGATIAFAIECYDKGLITKKDTDGIELTWGNHKAIIAMLEKMVKREGFGDVLADGSKRAAEKIGKGAEQYAMHVHGQEIPGHDPKANPAYGTIYKVDATPGRHTRGSEAHLGFAMGERTDPDRYTGRGELHKRAHNYGHVWNAAGLCEFHICWLTLGDILDSINAVTGWNIKTNEDLLVIGERISNMRQAFNIREGITIKDIKLPGRVIGDPAPKSGPVANKKVDIEQMTRDFLKLMDWDIETGKPSKAKLISLGLNDVAAALYR